MKTLIFCIALVLNLVASEEVKAQNLINNNLQLKVDVSDEYPVLTWKNKKETNTSYYLIEYSNDYFNFKILSTVKALGHSNYATNYSYTHITNAKIDSSRAKYYRVVLVLMDGTRVNSEIKALMPIDSTIDQNVIANIVK